ncbi:MAG: recombinase [Candidatus Aminicenantes bacterium]
MDEYEKYEAECKKRKEENHSFLTGFTRYLKNKKFAKRTIDKHVQNIDFYINDFLLYDSPKKASEGVNQLDYFLGFWFIRKAMWASPDTIKENIASLKHFYSYMNKIGQVKDKEVSNMEEEIKECKSQWIETVKKYDDPDFDSEDIW